MAKAFTRIDDDTIAKIEKTGMTVYQFLQEAAKEKLERRNVMFVEMVIEQNRKIQKAELEAMYESQLANMEDRMLSILNISHKLLQESVESHNTFREKINDSLHKILSFVKGS